MWKFVLSLLGIEVRPKLIVYTYGYLRYPFDNEQRFYLDAVDEVSADERAKAIMASYFDSGHTIMTACWRKKK